MEGPPVQTPADALVWVPASGGETVDNAVEAGQSSEGESLFVARAVTEEGEMSPGKLHMGHEAAHIPYAGKEHTFAEYQLLVNAGCVGLTWVSTSTCGGAVPVGAVQGGANASGLPIYIARVPHESGDLVPAKLVPHCDLCYAPWGCEEISYDQCEVLCVTTVQPPEQDC